MTDKEMTDEEMAEEYYYKTYPVTLNIGEEKRKKEVTDIFLAGLKAGRDVDISILENRIAELKQQIEKMKSIGRTSYIKGIRTMANALKDYDRTDGAWTDYFEHTVDKVLKELLSKEIE